MTDTPAPRALGRRLDGASPAPAAPTEDEQWAFVAEHLKAIRGLLAFIAGLIVVALAIWLMVVFGVIEVETQVRTTTF